MFSIIINAGVISPRLYPWGRSSAGRALDSHFRGQGFDPPRLHHKKDKGSDVFVGTLFMLFGPSFGPYRQNRQLFLHWSRLFSAWFWWRS